MNEHQNHDVVEMPLRTKRAVHLWCRTCRITSPGKVRDMTAQEVDLSHPMVVSGSRFD